MHTSDNNLARVFEAAEGKRLSETLVDRVEGGVIDRAQALRDILIRSDKPDGFVVSEQDQAKLHDVQYAGDNMVWTLNVQVGTIETVMLGITDGKGSMSKWIFNKTDTVSRQHLTVHDDCIFMWDTPAEDESPIFVVAPISGPAKKLASDIEITPARSNQPASMGSLVISTIQEVADQLNPQQARLPLA